MTNEEILVAIKADTTSLMSGLKAAESGVGNFSKQIRGIGVGMTVAGGAIALMVKNTSDAFDNYETKLVDMGKVTDESLEAIQDRIREVPPILGSATELMAGYYQIVSAGVKDTTEAMEVLTIGAQTAKAAHIEQSSVITGLTKVMAGYEGQIETVSEAADLLFAIEKEGQTTVAELIPVIGGLAKISYDLGISQDEMGASLAVVTKTAGNTAEATTRYEGVLTGLMKPTTAMTEALKAMGYETAEAAIKELGFVEVLSKLEEASGGSATAMAELFGRKEALMGVSALLSENGKVLADTILSIGEKTGSASKAFEDWSTTGEALNETWKSTFTNLKILIGEALDPMMDKLQIGLTDIVTKIVDWVKVNPELTETILKITAAVGGIMLVFGPLLVMLPGIVTAFGLVKGAISAIGIIGTGPIGLLILAVGAVYLAFKNWDKIIGVIQPIIDKVKSIFSGLIDYIKGIVGKIIDFVGSIGDKVKGVINKIKNIGKEGITVGVETKGGTSIPLYAAGTPYVPKTGLAIVHQGEEINPPGQRSYDQRKSNYTTSINIEPGAIVIQTPKFSDQDGEKIFDMIEKKAKQRGLVFARG